MADNVPFCPLSDRPALVVQGKQLWEFCLLQDMEQMKGKLIMLLLLDQVRTNQFDLDPGFQSNPSLPFSGISSRREQKAAIIYICFCRDLEAYRSEHMVCV